MRALLAAAVVALGLSALALATRLQAAEEPRELKWADLVPPAPPAPPKSPLAGRSMFSLGRDGTFNIGGDGPNQGDGTPVPPPGPEGRWMSGPAKRQSEAPPPVVAALDGQRVQIGGYVVPLDFDATTVKEFLLVPFVGACIHVPPPPANQIVYVKAEKGFSLSGLFAARHRHRHAGDGRPVHGAGRNRLHADGGERGDAQGMTRIGPHAHGACRAAGRGWIRNTG